MGQNVLISFTDAAFESRTSPRTSESSKLPTESKNMCAPTARTATSGTPNFRSAGLAQQQLVWRIALYVPLKRDAFHVKMDGSQPICRTVANSSSNTAMPSFMKPTETMGSSLCAQSATKAISLRTGAALNVKFPAVKSARMRRTASTAFFPKSGTLPTSTVSTLFQTA